MDNFVVLKDGYSAIQKHLLSEDAAQHGRTKIYLPACRSLEAFYLAEGKFSYDPAINSKFRKNIESQIQCGLRSERNGRLYRRFTFMIDDYYSGRSFQAIYSSGKRYKYKLDEGSGIMQRFT